MIFTRLKCTTFRLNLHLDDLGKKSYFIFNLAFKVKPFQLVHPKWPFFLKYFLCFGCLWCIYLYCSSLGKVIIHNGWFLNIMYLQTIASFSCENWSLQLGESSSSKGHCQFQDCLWFAHNCFSSWCQDQCIDFFSCENHLSQNRKRTKLNFWTWGDFGFVQTLAQILLVKDLPWWWLCWCHVEQERGKSHA